MLLQPCSSTQSEAQQSTDSKHRPHKGGVMCKALARSGWCASERTGGGVVLVLRPPCWGCKCGSLAHHVALP
eukprot:scaffold4364_cov119-Isochrysis_galbana.AAC.18